MVKAMQALLVIVILGTLTGVHAVKFGILTIDDANTLSAAICSNQEDHNKVEIIRDSKLVMLLIKETSQNFPFAIGLYDVGEKSFTVQFNNVDGNANTGRSPTWVIQASDRRELKDKANADKELRSRFDTSVFGGGEMLVLIPRPRTLKELQRGPVQGTLSHTSPLTNIQAVEEGFINTKDVPALENSIQSNSQFEHLKEKTFALVKMLTKHDATVLIGLWQVKNTQQFITVQFELVPNEAGSSTAQKYTLTVSAPSELMDKEAAEINLARRFIDCVKGEGDNVVLIPREIQEADVRPLPEPAQLEEAEQPPINPAPPQPLQDNNQVEVGAPHGGEQGAGEGRPPNFFGRIRVRKVCCGIVCAIGVVGVPSSLTIAFAYWLNPALFS